MKQLPKEFVYLKEMYEDEYFPNFLVDKVKKAIEQTVIFLEKENHSIEKIQEEMDRLTLQINEINKEFEENDSEIETVARECILDNIENILKYFEIDMDADDAMAEREW